MKTENLPVQLSQPVLENLGLPVAKQNEILELIVAIDEKAQGWKKLATFQIEGPQDIQGIKVAGENRLTIKRERREAMNFLDAKRKKVQEVMAEYTMEDKAYLRLSQFFEKLGKESEALLEEQEKIRERYEAEQRAKLREERLETLGAVCDTPDMYPVDGMSEEAFRNLYDGLKLAKEKAEREEAERLEAEEKRLLEEKKKEEELAAKRVVFTKRKEQMAPYFGVSYEGKGTITLDTSEEEYQTIFIAAKAALDKHEKELETLRAEKALREEKEESFKKKQFQIYAIGVVSNGTEYLYKGHSLEMLSDFSIETTNDEFTLSVEKLVGVIKQIDDAEKEAQELLAKQQEEARILKEKAEQEAVAKAAEEKAQASKVQTSVARSPKGASNASEEIDYVENWLAYLTSEASPDLSRVSENNLELVEIITRFDGYLAWATKKLQAAKNK
jgi:hypothetical protein